jgi:hypothetical protein
MAALLVQIVHYSLIRWRVACSTSTQAKNTAKVSELNTMTAPSPSRSQTASGDGILDSDVR